MTFQAVSCNQVWCADITYIPPAKGFPHLAAIMDWWSRKGLAWRLLNAVDGPVLCLCAG
jgi:putative transposase